MRLALLLLAAFALACGSNTPVGDGGSGTTGGSSTGGGGTGGLPGMGQACEPDAGCASGNLCIPVSTSAYSCFTACATTADCAITSSSCQAFGSSHICNGNLCGPTVPTGYTSSGPAYYAPCNAAGTGDGFCLPDDVQGLGVVGLCFAMGPVDAGLPAACSIDRSDAGALCPPGTFCLTNTGSGHGGCLPACAATAPFVDAGGTCAHGDVCFPFGSNPFGVCFAPCTSPGVCTTGLSCEDIPQVSDGGVCGP